eukprot:TRINITY_DN70063_c0_g1_i1.p1 TRINITY_DN70063_c0_g1~~TRINITY_DN70063_c0_g1_i1.p1  ORF type:complete len:269 (-),score=34.96 TRINITY_DN70063_c0_g1_i1:100-906(-)
MVDLSGGSGQKIDLSGSSRPSVDISGGGRASTGSSSGSYSVGGSQQASGVGGFGEGLAAAAMSNPTVKEQMKVAALEHAQQGLKAAGEGAAVAATNFGRELHKYIQEGPAGVSMLCFLGSLATAVVGALGLLNILSIVSSPFMYVLNVYLTAFGFIGAVLEADVSSLSKMKVIGRLGPWVEHYQTVVYRRAHFLTELFGRGLFYFFTGSLAVTQCIICLLFVVGLWNVLMGAICVLMSYGINPIQHLPVDGLSENGRRDEQREPLHPA